MTNLPRLFRQFFTALYGLITFTFVALVAYAATAGAFGNHSSQGGSISPSDCDARIKHAHDELINLGTTILKPYQQDRVKKWSTSEQKLGGKLEILKKGCPRLDHRQQIQAIGQLQQAYNTAIRGFEARGRDAVLRLQSTHGQAQDE